MSRPIQVGLVMAWVLAACALALPLHAAGGVTPHVEVFVGRCALSTDDTVIVRDPPDVRLVTLDGPGLSLGIRGGVTLHRWQFTAALARTRRDSDGGRLERQHLDLEAARLFGRPGASRLIVHGGLGIAHVLATDAQEAESRSGSLGTLSLGIGGHVPLGERFFLRPDASVRHFAGQHDGTDWQISAGFGFVLGKGAATAQSPSRARAAPSN